MRIGIESHFAEDEGSGNCTYTRNLIKNLAIIDKRNQYILYCHNKNISFYKEILKINENFRLIELKVKNKFLRIPLYLGYRTFKDKISIIHTQYYCPLLSRADRVVTVHDIIPIIHPHFFNWFEIFKQKFFLPFFTKKASKIITDSDNSKGDICKYLRLREDKVIRIYNGVSNEFKVFPQNERINILDKFKIGSPYIYYVGRLDPRKNLENIIKAFSIVALREKNLVLIIAGKKNEYFYKLFSLVKELNLAGRIKFTGLISNEDNIRLLNFAQFFIYPSIYEGFGHPVLEAMACGCPVITSRNSSLGEIAKDCALLINPKSVNEIESAMMVLLRNNVLRNDLIIFSWEFAARETLKVYKSLVNIR